MIIKCGAPGCGKVLPPATGARPREFCNSTCRSRAHRAKGGKGSKVAELPGRTVGGSGLTLATVVRRELEAANRLETVAGQQALTLAERMVAEASTTSSVVSASKELDRMLAVALAGVKPKELDAFDEIAAKRAQKEAASA